MGRTALAPLGYPPGPMGVHSWVDEPLTVDPPLFDEARASLERMDLLTAELDGRHGCLDAPLD
jgi:hypothetical protein